LIDVNVLNIHNCFFRTKTEEKRNTIDTEIKAEIDCIDCYEFEGTVLDKFNSSEFITHMNSNLTSNCSETNSVTENCDKKSTESNLTVHKRINTGKKQYTYM